MKTEKSITAATGSRPKGGKKVTAKKVVTKKRTVKSKTVKKTEVQLFVPLVPMIAAVPAEIKKHVNKIFPKPLEFEFMLALLLLVITEMSLILLQ